MIPKILWISLRYRCWSTVKRRPTEMVGSLTRGQTLETGAEKHGFGKEQDALEDLFLFRCFLDFPDLEELFSE